MELATNKCGLTSNNGQVPTDLSISRSARSAREWARSSRFYRDVRICIPEVEDETGAIITRYRTSRRSDRTLRDEKVSRHQAACAPKARLRKSPSARAWIRSFTHTWRNHCVLGREPRRSTGRCIAIYCFRDKSTWNRSRVNTSHFHATFVALSSSLSWSKYLSDSFNAPISFSFFLSQRPTIVNLRCFPTFIVAIERDYYPGV